MKKTDVLKKAVVALAIVAGGALVALPRPVMAEAAPAGGTTIDDCTGLNCISVGSQATGATDGPTDLNNTIKTVIEIILYIVGILAVVFIIYGGIKYATSAGDSAKVTSAKNTIMYSVIGLIIAILAYAIVQFVLGNLSVPSL